MGSGEREGDCGKTDRIGVPSWPDVQEVAGRRGSPYVIGSLLLGYTLADLATFFSIPGCLIRN